MNSHISYRWRAIGLVFYYTCWISSLPQASCSYNCDQTESEAANPPLAELNRTPTITMTEQNPNLHCWVQIPPLMQTRRQHQYFRRIRLRNSRAVSPAALAKNSLVIIARSGADSLENRGAFSTCLNNNNGDGGCG